MLATVLLGFVAGFFAGNGLPYFTEGSVGHGVNPSPFRQSPAANVVVGWVGLVVAGVAWAFAHASRHPLAGYGSAAVGVLLVGLIHAKVWRHNPWRGQPAAPPAAR
jgi:hypothetical protein